VNPVNPAISAFDLTGVWFTARTEICPALLRFFPSSPHCSRLLSTTLQARRGEAHLKQAYYNKAFTSHIRMCENVLLAFKGHLST